MSSHYVRLRHLVLLLVAAGFAAGCAPLGATGYPDRYPDRRRAPEARYPVPTRPPDPRTSRRADPRAYVRANRDAARYVRQLDRHLRLDRRQERRIQRFLADRAYERVTRKARRDRERYYPFPRQARDRANESWWKKTDRRIERVLSRQQRRMYRDLVRDYRRSHRYDRRQDRHRKRNDRRYGGRRGGDWGDDDDRGDDG